MKSDARRMTAALAAVPLVAALAAVPLVAALASLATPIANASGKPVKKASHAKAVPAAPARPSANSKIGGPLMASGGIVVNYPARDAMRLPEVPASAYVIADANTGVVLAAKDPHGLFPPASTLKVLTAITLIPRLSPNSLVTASKLAASVEPNVVGLIPTRRYQVADLFRALLLISANDAAVALAQATGSFSKGIALMNAEAHHLQAYDVVAKTPNGLPATGQVVSAYDLALIARQALAIPAFMKYDSTLAARFPVDKRKKVTLVNQNYLLTQYKGGIGGKIGWTIKAEATYIGLARRHGVTLIVTILHCTPLQEIYSAEKLLNWGFTMDAKVRPVGTLVAPLQPLNRQPVTHRSRVVTKSREHRAANAANSLAAAGSGMSRSAQIALAGAIAAVSCAALVAFIRLRRRLSGAKKPSS